jgi:hypothetical protein
MHVMLLVKLFHSFEHFNRSLNRRFERKHSQTFPILLQIRSQQIHNSNLHVSSLLILVKPSKSFCSGHGFQNFAFLFQHRFLAVWALNFDGNRTVFVSVEGFIDYTKRAFSNYFDLLEVSKVSTECDGLCWRGWFH